MKEEHQESGSFLRRQYFTNNVQFIRCRRYELGEGRQQFRYPAGRIHQRSRQNARYGMELVLQGGCYSEIPASTPDRPKEIWIRSLTGLDLPSVHCHQLCREQVVAGGAILRHQKSFSATECQARNPYSWTATRSGGQPVSLGCLVKVAHERTRLCCGHAFARVHLDPVHPGKIDDYTAITHAESSSVMASAAYCDRQILFLDKIECSRYVGRVCAPHDQRGAPIKCAVEDQAG